MANELLAPVPTDLSAASQASFRRLRVAFAPRRIRVEKAVRHQTLDGFGTNVTPAQWREGALGPVLTQLVRDVGCQLIRLDAYGRGDWLDPQRRGADGRWPQAYLETVYTQPVFRDAWETARYLQALGAEVILNVSGDVPAAWKDTKTQTLVDFDAYAEMQATLVLWAREREGLSLRLHMPFNELDLPNNIEGPSLQTTEQRLGLWSALRAKFAERGLGDLRHVIFCDAGVNLERMGPVIAAPTAFAGVHAVSGHTYGNGLEGDMSSDWLFQSSPVKTVNEAIARSAAPSTRLWITEFGDLDQTGEIEWEIAWRMARRLMLALEHGLHAALTWDAFDNFHVHDMAWATYGLLHVDPTTWTYTPKRRYYAMKHFFRYLRAGWTRVEIAGLEQDPQDVFKLWHDPLRNVRAQAFFSPDGSDLTIIVLTQAEHMTELSIELPDFSADKLFAVYVSMATRDHEALTPVRSVSGVLTVPLRPRSLLTITSLV
jgi:O-glycosyl hydrolase